MIRLNQIEFTAPPELIPLANRVKAAFESYRIPVSVAKKTGVKRLSDVSEPWLIVLCTPKTPGDPDVSEAIARFTKNGNYAKILTLLAEGTPETSFPLSLLFEDKGDGTVVEHEPLAANIVADSEKDSLKRLRIEKLRLLAPILGVPFDDLLGRHRRRQRRILAVTAAALILGAGSFLGYALSRMRVMSAQEAELTRQYEQTEEARKEADRERDAARRSLAGTVALEAASLLEAGDAELAMMLCLSYLPEMEEVTELTQTFEKALQKRCGQGFVPITTAKVYERTRGIFEETKPEEEEAAGPERFMDVSVPDDQPYKKEMISMEQLSWSEESGYALYTGILVPEEGSNISCLYAYYPDAPEKSHYILDEKGEYRHASAAVILPDGSFYAVISKTAVRIDPERDDALLSVFDGGEETEVPVSVPIQEFSQPDGFEDRILGLARHGLEVYCAKPFRYLYTIDDAYTTANNTAPDGSTYWTGFAPIVLENGKRLFLIGLQHVYDAETGNYLYSIEDYGLSVNNNTVEVTAEGWLPFLLGDTLIFWDLASNTEAGRIPDINSSYYSYGIAGPADEKTGRSSASVVRMTSSKKIGSRFANIVWEYRDTAVKVPKGLTAQIELAKELLGSRELTRAERKKYLMEE